MRMMKWVACALVAILLNACGGGGGGGSHSTSTTTPPVTTSNPTPATCGATVVNSTNSQTICVSGGPTGNFTNVVLISVTVCFPGSTTACTTIPNIQVDTGSSGLRIFNSQIASLGLQPVLDGNNNPVGECGAFADGIVWGELARADVRVADEVASNIPVQVILDNSPTTPSVPTDCSNQGTPEQTVSLVGANGILGVGLFVQDCGQGCVGASVFTDPSNNLPAAQYYDCPTNAATCTPVTLALANQVINPVSAFAVDNNGVILEIPAIPNTGYPSVNATIVFGINTQTNNQLGATTVINVPDTGTSAGFFSVTYAGAAYPESFLDSGSSVYFFNSTSVPSCPSTSIAKAYLCPGSSAALSLEDLALSVTGSAGNSIATTAQIANATYLFNTSSSNIAVFNDLAAPAGSTLPDAFDIGVPFFFGKNVYTGLETNTTPAGPFFAWTAN